ncbi:MAG: permease [Francisellaceae bacterium]|nr:permease [Francisellaceae bacterium]
MKIIDTYLGNNIIKAVLTVALALLGLELFFGFINEHKFIGRGNYFLKESLSYLLLTTPRRLYGIFPWASLIGSLIALGQLATNSELIVMRSCGISIARIAYSTLKAACILIMIVVMLGEGLAPFLENKAQSKRSFALSGGQVINTPYGLWMRQGKDFIYANNIVSKEELENVSQFKFDQVLQLKRINQANFAKLENKEWQLKDVHSSIFLPDVILNEKPNSIPLPNFVDPDVVKNTFAKHLDYLSLKSLKNIIEYRKNNDLNAQSYQLAFWKKIYQPIAILVMMFLAIPFIFGPLRSATMGFRMLAGILLSFVFLTLNGIFTSIGSVSQIPPYIAALIPSLVFLSLAAILMKRLK